MREPIVSDKYAEALFLTAKKQGSMELIAEEIHQLHPLFAVKSDLRRFFEGPQITTEAKFDLAKKVFENQISLLLYKFLIIVLRKHRMDHISEIFREYLKLVDKEHGIQEARVITAIPLDSPTLSRLQARLEEIIHKQIRLRSRVDSKIIGGVIVQVNHTLIDGSFRTKLLELRDDLLSVKVH